MDMFEATDHDQLFKEVIREFFPDFLRLFFPDQAVRFDLSQVHWLDKELFADPPDGPRHLLDLVAELTLLGGGVTETSLALIHIEIESAESVTDIERRLPDYYFYLRRTSQKPVLPMVVFLKVGIDGIGIREVIDRFDGEPVMTLRYRYVGLPALPAADYLRGDNWLGVALSALMKSPKNLRVPFGVEAIQRLGGSPLSDGKKSLLGDCVETYIDIPDEDSKRFQDILEANATGRVPAMHKTRVQIAHEKGIEKGIETGIEKGMEEGHHRGMRAAVTELLEAKFGPVPTEFTEWVGKVTDLSSLRRLLLAAGTSPSFDEFRSTVGW
jgi:hypothetical protein